MNESTTSTMPRRKKTRSDDKISLCQCGKIPECFEHFQEGRKISRISCCTCGKITPPLVHEIAVKYWNMIALYRPLPRVLEYNEWGICKSNPTEIISERHNKNEITIRVFKDGNAYFYGFDIRLGSFFKVKQATILDQTYKEIQILKSQASAEIKKLCKPYKEAKKLFLDFGKIAYNQLDLF